jgi:hypothetical protein
MEQLCKAAGGSMAHIRKAGASNPDFVGACKAALLPVRELLSKRFESLELKGTSFKSYFPASDEQMLDLLSFCIAIDSTLPSGHEGLHLKSKDLKAEHPRL